MPLQAVAELYRALHLLSAVWLHLAALTRFAEEEEEEGEEDDPCQACPSPWCSELCCRCSLRTLNAVTVAPRTA